MLLVIERFSSKLIFLSISLFMLLLEFKLELNFVSFSFCAVSVSVFLLKMNYENEKRNQIMFITSLIDPSLEF